MNPQFSMVLLTGLIVILTAIYVVATVFYVCISFGTLKKIEEQVGLARDALVVTQRSADAANQSVEAMTQQAISLRKQIEMTTASERAMLAVDISPDNTFNNLIFPTAEIAEVKIRIAHYGPTNAFSVNGTGALSVRKDRQRPDGKGNGLQLPSVIEAGTKPFDIGLPIGLEPQIKTAIVEEKIFLHCYGQITYADIFGNEYPIPFWYMWKVECFSPFVEDAGTLDDSYWENRLTADTDTHTQQ